jgi:hypothetical protein
MNQHGKIGVIDRDGWQREYPLHKNIVRIGSDPRNDIVLESERGMGVAPLHAQLITSTGKSGYQLVNLGDVDILLSLSGDQAIPPRSATNIVSGTVFKIGEFTLIFYSDVGGDGVVSGGFTSSSEHVGLRVSLPRTWLEPNRSLGGVVTVSNLGDLGVQFNLELEGLEPDCYDIEPGPILASGAEKELLFHLYHRGNKPLAGDHHIAIRATAPRAYPAEQATVSQVIRVLPFFRHKLHIVPPAKVGSSRRVKERQVPTVEVGPPPPPAERAPEAKAGSPSQVEDWWAPAPIVAVERAPQAEAAAPLPAEVSEPTSRAETSPSLQVEEPTPEVEAGLPSPVAAEPTPQTGTGLPTQVEEEREPEAEIVPSAPMEDEWAPAAEAGPEERQVLKLKASPLPETETEQAQVEAGPSPPAEDWWSAETEAEAVLEEETEERQVLKLKASPPTEAETEQGLEAESGPPPTEDWWSAEAEAGPEEETEGQQVLKLKASPLPETEEKQAQAEAGPSPLAEDWWTPQPETDTPPPIEEESAQVEADASSRAEEERAPETEADAQ